MFQEILEESPIYQEIVQSGREEEREKTLQRLRAVLVDIVQLRFSELKTLAHQQVEGITVPDTLSSLMLQLVAAQQVDEARRLLLAASNGQSEVKHTSVDE